MKQFVVQRSVYLPHVKLGLDFIVVDTTVHECDNLVALCENEELADRIARLLNEQEKT